MWSSFSALSAGIVLAASTIAKAYLCLAFGKEPIVEAWNGVSTLSKRSSFVNREYYSNCQTCKKCFLVTLLTARRLVVLDHL